MKQVHSTTGPESPLAFDLCLGRATLAALKAEAQLPPTEAELVAVERLCSHLRELLQKLKGGHRLPSEFIKAKKLRTDLETAFAGIAHSTPQPRADDPQLLQQLADLLSQLSKARALSRANASTLLAALHELGHREIEMPRPLDVNTNAR